MQWKIKPIPKIGDVMVKTKFAWFPTRIGTTRVWLEKYTAIYEFVQYRYWGVGGLGEGRNIIEWRLVGTRIGVHDETN